MHYKNTHQAEHIHDYTLCTCFYLFIACEIQSVEMRVNVIDRNSVVTFSAVPYHPEVTYRCKLNNGRYKPCEYDIRA